MGNEKRENEIIQQRKTYVSDLRLIYLMFTQITDNKYIMSYTNYNVYAICMKCTPSCTLIAFIINHLSVNLKKNAKNVHRCEYLYCLLSIGYWKWLLIILHNLMTKQEVFISFRKDEISFESFAGPLRPLRFVLSFWTILPKYPNFEN